MIDDTRCLLTNTTAFHRLLDIPEDEILAPIHVIQRTFLDSWARFQERVLSRIGWTRWGLRHCRMRCDAKGIEPLCPEFLAQFNRKM